LAKSDIYCVSAASSKESGYDTSTAANLVLNICFHLLNGLGLSAEIEGDWIGFVLFWWWDPGTQALMGSYTTSDSLKSYVCHICISVQGGQQKLTFWGDLC